MAIKPMLFNTEMVQAILEGQKTQTRRVVKGIERLNVYRAEPAEDAYETLGEWDFLYGMPMPEGGCLDCFQPVKAPCSIGDTLWVRETFCKFFGEFIYKAGQREGWNSLDCASESWCPSIHMPKEAARIFLRVTGIRVERLGDMTEEDAIAEGFPDSPAGESSPWERFRDVWDKTIKRDDLRYLGFDANPWVFVIEFERCEKPEGWCCE